MNSHTRKTNLTKMYILGWTEEDIYAAACGLGWEGVVLSEDKTRVDMPDSLWDRDIWITNPVTQRIPTFGDSTITDNDPT